MREADVLATVLEQVATMRFALFAGILPGKILASPSQASQK
jgi:hypothetical protein